MQSKHFILVHHPLFPFLAYSWRLNSLSDFDSYNHFPCQEQEEKRILCVCVCIRVLRGSQCASRPHESLAPSSGTNKHLPTGPLWALAQPQLLLEQSDPNWHLMWCLGLGWRSAGGRRVPKQALRLKHSWSMTFRTWNGTWGLRVEWDSCVKKSICRLCCYCNKLYRILRHVFFQHRISKRTWHFLLLLCLFYICLFYSFLVVSRYWFLRQWLYIIIIIN